MKRLFLYGTLCALGLMWFGGCTEETKVKKTETTKTPSGSTTTTDEHKVEKK